MRRRVGEWTVAVTLALAVHGGVLAAIIDWDGEQVRRERSAGRESVVWGVPMSAAAEAVEGEESVEETVAPEVAEPVEASPPAAQANGETSEPQPTEETAETPASMAVRGSTSDRAVADDVAEAEASPEAPSETEAAEPVRTARAADAAEAEIVEPAEEPVARPRRKPQELAEKAAAERRAEEARRAKSRARSASSNAAAGQAKGSGSKRQADGGRADASNYAGRVLAHLQRHKRYPSAAARRRLSGVVTVRFSIDKAGSLRAVAIAGGSGASTLDEAALAMVRSASPFPAIPENMNKGSMSFTVPVRYRPR